MHTENEPAGGPGARRRNPIDGPAKGERTEADLAVSSRTGTEQETPLSSLDL